MTEAAPKLTVRAVKTDGGIDVLMLCDEHGRALPNQTAVTYSAHADPGHLVGTVTVTFTVDGENVALHRDEPKELVL
ncbi:hypothetical protein ACW7BJ_33305 [Azospirillum argentinense]